MPFLKAMFDPVALNDSEPVVVYAKEYLQKVSDLIQNTNKRYQMCTCVTFHLIKSGM